MTDNLVNDTISRAAAIDAFLTELTKRERKNFLHTWSTVEVKYFVADMLEKLPSAQQIPWDKNTRNSMKYTIQSLYRLAYHIHGVMDSIDNDNVYRLIEWLEGGQDGEN